VRRLGTLLLALLVVVPAASAGGAPPVLAFDYDHGYVTVARLDPTSLRQIGDGRAEGGPSGVVAIARSPDGNRIALGTQYSAIVRVVDLRAMRSSEQLFLGEGRVTTGLWTRAGRLVVVAQAKPSRIHVIDARTTRLVRSVELPGTAVAVARGRDALVAVIGPVNDIGPLHIARVDGMASVRTAALPLQGGWFEKRNPTYVMREHTPGLAVSPDGKRAVVVATGGRAVEVSLPGLRVRPRPLAVRTAQKLTEGWLRRAEWLDSTHVAVTGVDIGDGRGSSTGLQLLDTKAWTLRTLDEGARSFARAGSTLLAWGERGVTGWTLDGVRRYHLFPERRIGDVGVGPTFLYVQDSGHRTHDVVDPASGRVLGRARTARPVTIAG
jgi:hypothetical protein